MGLSNNLGKLSNMITSTGSAVGIGTSSPSSLLNVIGGEIKWGFTSDLGALSYSGGNPMVQSIGATSLLFNTNGSERMRITSTGNVGIGTASPGQKLVITTSGGSPSINIYDGTSDIYLGIATSAGGYANGAAAGDLVIRSASGTSFSSNGGSSTAMRIASGGDVGINGLVPTVKLAVFGSATSTDYAFIAYNSGGFAIISARNNGNVNVPGALSKGSGSFKIEHPLESMKDTHNLVHSFVESPQANNIYRGKVELVNGLAQVNLDEVSTMTEGTFVILNRDIHTYTSNETNWDAVKGKIDGNILIIECENSQSSAIVSWLVIGERQDKHIMDTDWTDKNGKVIVEPLKEEVPNNKTEPIHQD